MRSDREDSPFARVLLLKQIAEMVASIAVLVYTTGYTPRPKRIPSGVGDGSIANPPTRKSLDNHWIIKAFRVSG